MKKEKGIYFPPQINHIKLDNEISLALESTPPFGPNELVKNTPEYFNIDPFKNNNV